MIDVISYYCLRYFKNILEKKLKAKDIFDKYNTRNFASVNIMLVLLSPELNSEIQIRSSRDRIARGALINIIILLLVVLFAGVPFYIAISETKIIISLIVLTVIAVITWFRFEKLTIRYRRNAFETLAKLEENKNFFK